MKRALVLFAHPCPESYGAALHTRVVETLRAAGWEVDDCDLNAEGFNPVLTEHERRYYHDEPENIEPVRAYVERVRAADALVLVYPVWNFGFPAIMKGFIDRVFLPGVAFRLENGIVKPNLTNIKSLAAVCTYGGSRMRAFLAGDPPRKIVCRALRFQCTASVRLQYTALYDMNRNTRPVLERHLDKVGQAMTRL